MPLQPQQLLQEVAQICERTFPKSIVLCQEIPPSLAVISGDFTQLHQVLMNLCVNARDAMPIGGRLWLRAENFWVDETYARMNLAAHVGPYVVITVADTGTGMAPEVLERIFDPFFTTKAVGQGTGLGLSVVQGIITAHGGFVQVASKPGQGSEFKVYLPAINASIAPPLTGQDLPLGQGELILIVEDETNLLQVIKTTLEDSNYRVLTATNGIEAIALYFEYRNDIRVVLLDMLMPELDGQTAIQVLRKMNPAVKVIATSGLPSALELAPSVRTKMTACLPKPYTNRELLVILDQVLGTAAAKPLDLR